MTSLIVILVICFTLKSASLATASIGPRPKETLPHPPSFGTEDLPFYSPAASPECNSARDPFHGDTKVLPSPSPWIEVLQSSPSPELELSPSPELDFLQISPSPELEEPQPSSVPGNDEDPYIHSPPTEFTSRTFRRSLRNKDSFYKEDPVDQSRKIKVDLDIKLRASGVVSLNGMKSFIRNITCSEDGTVRIQLKKSAPVSSLQTMYPKNAVLAIDHSVFGSCRISPPRRKPAKESKDERQERLLNEELSHSAEFSDTFMFISSVTGSPQNAIVSGTPTFFFSMFEEASFNISREPAANENLKNSSRFSASNTEENGRMMPTTIRQTPWKRELTFKLLKNLELKTKTLFYNRIDFKGVNINWKYGLMNIETVFIHDYSIDSTMTLAITKGVSSRDFVKEIGNVLVYGLQGLGYLDKLSNDGTSFTYTLPQLKVGIYFELALVANIGLKVKLNSQLKAEQRYETGRREITVFLRGFLPIYVIGSRTKVLSSFSFQNNFLPQVPNQNSRAEFTIKGFLGLRPRIALYIPFMEGKVSVDLGVELAAKTNVPFFKAFSPVKTGRTFGSCDTCHHIRVEGSFKLRNPMLSGRIAYDYDLGFLGQNSKFKVDREGKLPFPDFSISKKFATACFIPEFEGNAEVCGESCCDKRSENRCRKSDSLTEPTCGASPSPSPASPTPVPEGVEAASFTDPHLRTFDGLAFDCQAIGEFVMTKSQAAGFEVQARFSGPNTKGTVTTGVAVRVKNSATVQVSIALKASKDSVQIGGCQTISFVNSVVRDLRSGSGLDDVDVSVVSNRYQIQYKNDISVSFSVRPDPTFGCFMESLIIFLPRKLLKEDVRGLLGTPNGNTIDDWTDSLGKVFALPTTEEDFLFERAYNYCTAHWCLRDESKSLFTYETGTSFNSYKKCDLPYQGPLDLSNVPHDVKDVCQSDSACLVDGIVGGVAAARQALTVQSRVEEQIGRRTTVFNKTTGKALITFEPPVIPIAVPTTVTVTLKLRGKEIQREGLLSFILYQIDSSGESTSLVLLEEAQPGNFVSNIELVAYRADENFRFRVVPHVNYKDVNDSSLVTEGRLGVRATNNLTGNNLHSSDQASIIVPNLSGVEIVAHSERSLFYDFARGIDVISTTFLNKTVGILCSDESLYLSTDVIITPSALSETSIVKIGKARTDGMWSKSTVLRLSGNTLNTTDRSTVVRITVREDSGKKKVIGTLSLSVTLSILRTAICPGTPFAELRIVDGIMQIKLTLIKSSE